VNFLTDPREKKLPLWPTNMCVGGKNASVDLTNVSPLMGLRTRAFAVNSQSRFK
jgi:hypothetical protein